MRKGIQKLAVLAFGLVLISAPASGQGRYVRLQGQILSSASDTETYPFHLDAYKLTGDGQRQLVRLSRFSGPDYHLYLEAGFDHEVLIQMLDHPPYTVLVKAIDPIPDATDRLLAEQDFLVPVAKRTTTPITSKAPAPPEFPEFEVSPMYIEAEPAGLLLTWGDTSTFAVPVPGYTKEQVEPLNIASEEAVRAGPPVRMTAYAVPLEWPREVIVPISIEDEVLSAAGYGSPLEENLGLIEAGGTPGIVATIGIRTREGAPEHPGMLKDVANAELPPAPRRARLRAPTNMVAGLTSIQQVQSIAHLSKGQEIQVIEYTTPEWWMVAHGSVIGWVRAEHLE